ncbi:MAG: putative cell survival pathways protein [Claussenomyces sp. TS43310]|nr:MAG: putative cell survival pathways protein [Claussenomyces sp. TS43310]
MFNWAKQQMANVVGTEEPIYGPSAVQSVAEQAKTKPYTELKREDLKWAAMVSTCVETQSFYLTADSGHAALAQVIYSNVAGLRTTCQFNTKIFYPAAEKKQYLWSSDPLSNVDFSDDKVNFYADNVAVELNDDGTTYSIKSMTNPQSIVNLSVTRTAPGFVVGEDGKTNFGTDLADPWGTMRHAFWPRAKCEGTILTKDGPIDFKGVTMFVHALQGMKPHHAAAKWDFVNFQGPEYSAVMMEYTTPPSYGSTRVNVGGIAKDGEIIAAGSSNSATHTQSKEDAQNDWPEPEAVKFVWSGQTKDGKSVDAVLEGPLDERLDRVDVMAEVPGFVKAIVASAVGTKPYIYQYSPHTPISLSLKIGDEETVAQGTLFSEATFISA